MDSRFRENDRVAIERSLVIPAKAGIHFLTINNLYLFTKIWQILKIRYTCGFQCCFKAVKINENGDTVILSRSFGIQNDTFSHFI